MKTQWDYSNLASFYDKRPDYAPEALDQLFDLVGVTPEKKIADIGAGTGKLTIPLLKRKFHVVAVEPNDEMRKKGISNTNGAPVRWLEGTGEATGLPENSVYLATFGSSFNVTDRKKTLAEAARILEKRGWFACMWNHRDLTDPLQAKVEKVITDLIPGYDYGTRREDQTEVLKESGLFVSVKSISGKVVHKISKHDYVEAWRSHATLERQAGKNFTKVISAIENALEGITELEVPYTTRIWAAQLKGN